MAFSWDMGAYKVNLCLEEVGGTPYYEVKRSNMHYYYHYHYKVLFISVVYCCYCYYKLLLLLLLQIVILTVTCHSIIEPIR